MYKDKLVVTEGRPGMFCLTCGCEHLTSADTANRYVLQKIADTVNACAEAGITNPAALPALVSLVRKYIPEIDSDEGSLALEFGGEPDTKSETLAAALAAATGESDNDK